jgi:phosphoglucosamine mutase
MADASGATYDGDQLLYVIACRRAQEGRLRGVVGTLMTNLAFERALGGLGVGFARAKVGDRYVLEVMQERGWDLGGENSGHIICLDKHTTGDAIVSALQVLEAVRRDGRGLAELAGSLRLYPQKLINVRVAREFDWQGDAAIGQARPRRRAARGARPAASWGIRYQPVLSVMVEGEDEAEVTAVAASSPPGWSAPPPDPPPGGVTAP